MTASNKPVLTKAEKIAAIVAQIEKLKLRKFNIENDIVVAPVAKVVALPEVGTEVTFTYGRKTDTTEPSTKTGVVKAVKPVGQTADGKKTPAQIKVEVGTGFDAEIVVIYPAQIQAPAKAEGEESNADVNIDEQA